MRLTRPEVDQRLEVRDELAPVERLPQPHRIARLREHAVGKQTVRLVPAVLLEQHHHQLTELEQLGHVRLGERARLHVEDAERSEGQAVAPDERNPGVRAHAEVHHRRQVPVAGVGDGVPDHQRHPVGDDLGAEGALPCDEFQVEPVPRGEPLVLAADHRHGRDRHVADPRGARGERVHGAAGSEGVDVVGRQRVQAVTLSGVQTHRTTSSRSAPASCASAPTGRA